MGFSLHCSILIVKNVLYSTNKMYLICIERILNTLKKCNIV